MTGNATGKAVSARSADTAKACTSNAATATKLATASFDGSANVSPGVTGVLAVNNGGTGATSAANAAKNLGVPLVTKSTNTTVGSGLTVMPRIVIASSAANALAISKANTDAIVLYAEQSIKRDLRRVDAASVRALRAICLGQGTEEDQTALAALEKQAQSLRGEFAALRA